MAIPLTPLPYIHCSSLLKIVENGALYSWWASSCLSPHNCVGTEWVERWSCDTERVAVSQDYTTTTLSQHAITQWIILILGRPGETSQAFCNEASCCLHLSVHDRDGTLQRRALSCNRIPLAQIFCMLRKPEWDCHYIITMHLWEVATKNTCVRWGSHIMGNRGEEELAFTCNIFKCVPSKRITDNKPCGERPII